MPKYHRKKHTSREEEDSDDKPIMSSRMATRKKQLETHANVILQERDLNVRIQAIHDWVYLQVSNDDRLNQLIKLCALLKEDKKNETVELILDLVSQVWTDDVSVLNHIGSRFGTNSWKDFPDPNRKTKYIDLFMQGERMEALDLLHVRGIDTDPVHTFSNIEILLHNFRVNMPSYTPSETVKTKDHIRKIMEILSGIWTHT